MNISEANAVARLLAGKETQTERELLAEKAGKALMMRIDAGAAHSQQVAGTTHPTRWERHGHPGEPCQDTTECYGGAFTAADLVVARAAHFDPVYHEASGRVFRTAWLVSFEVIATGSRLNCCDSAHGHRTKKTAKACLAKTLARMIRNQQVTDCANPERDHDRTIPSPGCELRATEVTDRQTGEQ